MGWIIDWLADQVQSATGEKDRKQNVSKIKELVQEFKEKVSESIDMLNSAIQKFNHWIKGLNKVRNEKIGENIICLCNLLQKYGRCKPCEKYIEESTKLDCSFPETEYQQLEDYVGEIDWSSDDVFWNTFLLSPIGMRHKTRKQNIQLTESANDLQLLIDETLKELEIKRFTTELETAICQMYVENVMFISEMINNVIVPELQIIDAFFQAEKIKNLVICDKESENINFTYNIAMLAGTKYQNHYQFIKNALAFYIVACKIYDTPVLSRLLKHTVTENDRELVEKEKEVLSLQSGKVQGFICFNN